MNNSLDAFNPMSLPPRELARLVWFRRKTWVGACVICSALAAAVSLVLPHYWEATQGLVVRQETAGSTGTRPGKFADLFEMRTLQETILEIAKSNQVVVGTIQAVDGTASSETPTLEDIEKFRNRLKMLPPDGGEFGKTEVFYFQLKDSNRDRAIRLVGELCRQLETALRELRTHRADGLIAELEEEASVAGGLLNDETKKLAEFEGKVGADLGELRMLQSANSGQSDLRLESVQLDADVRRFRTQVSEGEQLLRLLRGAETDPQKFVATPNSLLELQPALRRLKDGLIDAQLATSRLSGTRSADHPQVKAAIESERQIRTELHDELVTAIKGAEIELQLARDRLSSTQARLDNLQKRFEQLASWRAEYSNHLAAVENLRVSLDHARQNLSAAKAARAAAHSGSLVTRFDKPETGPHPAGLGRTMITAAGGMAGLLLGLGIVFLTAAPIAGLATEECATHAADWGTGSSPVVHTKPQRRSEVEASSHESAPAAHAANGWWGAAPAASQSPAAVENSKSASVAPAPVISPIVVAPMAPAASAEAPVPPAEMQPKSTRREATPEAPRKRRDAIPSSVGALPTTSGSLPSLGGVGSYGGMNLQEALQAAARQMSN